MVVGVSASLKATVYLGGRGIALGRASNPVKQLYSPSGELALEPSGFHSCKIVTWLILPVVSPGTGRTACPSTEIAMGSSDDRTSLVLESESSPRPKPIPFER